MDRNEDEGKMRRRIMTRRKKRRMTMWKAMGQWEGQEDEDY